MTRNVKILGISGSLRTASYNTGLLHAAVNVAPPEMEITLFDLSPLPLYNADNDVDRKPEPVNRFKTAIAAADALLIATPEYNYSVPGVLKNAIDWASRGGKESPLNGKPLAIFGTSQVRLHRALALLLQERQHPLLLARGAGAQRNRDEVARFAL